jgi:plastocyanin
MVKKLVAAFFVAALLMTLAGCVVQSAPAAAGNTITMGATTYNQTSITIKKGQTITFVDDKATGSMHILVIGVNGAAKPEAGAPDFNGSTGITFQPGQSWTSKPWDTPGVYDVTCIVHPLTMNLKVTVTG